MSGLGDLTSLSKNIHILQPIGSVMKLPTATRNEATLSFLGVPPRPLFSLRSISNCTRSAIERSENGGLGACPQESAASFVGATMLSYSTHT